MKRQLATTALGADIEATGAQRHRDRVIPEAPLSQRLSAVLYAAASASTCAPSSAKSSNFEAARAKLRLIRNQRG